MGIYFELFSQRKDVLLVLACTLATGVPMTRPVAQWTSKPRCIAFAAWVSVGTILALTITPRSGITNGPGQLEYCLGAVFDVPGIQDPFGTEGILNLLLYVPAGFFLALLVPRVMIAPGMLALVSLAIELLQGFIGRTCASSDWFMNSLGAAVGALLAAAWICMWRRGRQFRRA